MTLNRILKIIMSNIISDIIHNQGSHCRLVDNNSNNTKYLHNLQIELSFT